MFDGNTTTAVAFARPGGAGGGGGGAGAAGSLADREVSQAAANRFPAAPICSTLRLSACQKGYPTTDGVNIVLSAKRCDGGPLLFTTLRRMCVTCKKGGRPITNGVNVNP